ncbi:MAG: CBS domain-containing protein [Nitrospirae bacterium]|nr:CBS domain-containing protein [Nitrospirota bacterium]
MDIITSHTNADFDSLASMVAAKKLYPEAKVVFPGSQEKGIRDFFHKTNYDLPFDKIKNIKLQEISRLILVDTRSPGRIGRFADIIGRSGLKIHIYDHHPFIEGDIKGEEEFIGEVGATTTIFIEILKDKDIEITPMEATIFALGIYEETGSLTFPTTTERDLFAVAYIISKGADLKVVSDFITRELDREQLSLLNELIQSAKSYLIGGIKVVVATASTEKYLPELAVLVHKMRDMEGLDVLFVAVRMDERIHMVARSRVPSVDVREIASEFGGGGHSTASYATVRDISLNEFESKLVDVLRKKIIAKDTARRIMTSPVKTIQDSTTIKEAEDVMTRYGVNVLPVLKGETFLGLISREVVEKSLFHNLGETKVSELMTTDVHTATVDTPVSKIEETMIEHNQRFMPILDGLRILGAITRTDLLRALHEDVLRKGRIPEEGLIKGGGLMKNVAALVEDRLPAKLIEILKKVGSIAEGLGFSAYLVGGIVRDILLAPNLIQDENLDIDIVIEGDGIAFANRISKELSVRVKSHQKFGTSVILLQDGLKFDVATARTEYYKSPGALPTVEISSIKKDLYRRDFTINSLAIKLNAKEYGTLVDFFGGQRDLKDKVIRILHNLSFIEDPTRVFRAIRFEQRFNFKIGKHTANLIKSAVKMDLFHKLSGPRLYGELVLIFSEAEPLKALKRMAEFDLLRFIHPRLVFTKGLGAIFEGIQETLSWFKLLFLEGKIEKWLIFFVCMMDELKNDEVTETCERLSIPERLREKILKGREDTRVILYEFFKEKRMKPSKIYRLLKPVPLEILLFMMAKAKDETSKRYISLYLTELQKVKVSLSGSDLKEMGIEPGPLYKKILDRLLEGRLNGEIRSKAEEKRFIRENY